MDNGFIGHEAEHWLEMVGNDPRACQTFKLRASVDDEYALTALCEEFGGA
jgi:hypothetical protein